MLVVVGGQRQKDLEDLEFEGRLGCLVSSKSACFQMKIILFPSCGPTETGSQPRMC